MGRKRAKQRRLEIVHPNCAGIDIGKRRVYVAVSPGHSEETVRNFGTFTDDYEALVQWLVHCQVRVVAMESTGVYWIALYELLERHGFEVHLVNPRATKQVSGRKSDVLDCEWLWQLMSYGLLKGAFRPPDDVCVLRIYARERARLVRDASRSVQHIQKALTQMNVQLDTVLSDLMGTTGQRIVRAIVEGERNGATLARHRDRRVKADEVDIARSLRGNWREEHLFSLRQALQRYDFLHTQMRECEQRIGDTLKTLDRAHEFAEQPLATPGRNPRERGLQLALRQMLGVDLTAIPTIGVETALMVASEIGPDLSRFPNCEHFCSWLTLAPGTRISGDKNLGGPPQRRTNRAGQALRVAASTARNSQSFIGASHRARLARMDTPRAIKATAHQLARLIYAMLTRGEDYVERGIVAFEAEREGRRLRALRRNAHQLGFQLVETDPKLTTQTSVA